VCVCVCLMTSECKNTTKVSLQKGVAKPASMFLPLSPPSPLLCRVLTLNRMVFSYVLTRYWVWAL
jgi:hypothetical protein